MATRTQQLFGQSIFSPYKTPTTTNVEGYPAWNRTVEEELVQQLVTNTLGNQFYVTQKELVKTLGTTIDKAIKANPIFVAKAAVYARQHGFMRTAPTLALVKLSAANIPLNVFEFAFFGVINTPKDLIDFTTMLNASGRGEGGRRIKRTVSKWLETKLTEYWVIKYGSEKGAGYNLNGMLRVYHPKLNNALANYILGNGKYDRSLTQINAFENLKLAENYLMKIQQITNGRLPHEVATTFAGNDKEVWKAIVPQMPIFALLRNLATIERVGIMPQVRDAVVAKLTDEKTVRNSKIFPFQFLTAMEHVSDSKVRDALRDAIDLSFNNLPEITGTTAVALDVSGSMSGNPIKIASLFAISLYKKTNGSGYFIKFSDRASYVPISMRDSTLTQAERVRIEGGTNTSTPLQLLLKEGKKVDNFILITDEAQNRGRPFYKVVEDYRKAINPNLKVFIVDVASYQGVLTPDDKNIFYIYGWSDRVLDFISFATTGYEKVQGYIESLMDSQVVVDEE